MRRYAAATAAALSLTAALAAPAAADGEGDGEWRPVTYSPIDYAAGVRCDFAFRIEQLVDEVMVKTVDTYPDGSPKTELYKGTLIARVINTETGAFYDADASGRSVVEYAEDGSQVWHATGPVLIGFQEGQGNLPRGEYVVDGVYTVQFSPAGQRTVTWTGGTESLIDVCDQID
ncbi:hypothetical protein AB0M28_14960 [Streptomyces sp. NPDC051940]|uniref:hypothetical protein n=1 Tax=Streptomyces sp. NPDC051940 TaxID=3155675 RepID=UPI00342B9164